MESSTISIFVILVLLTSQSVYSKIVFPFLSGQTETTPLSCSDFEPQKNFEMKKFLGEWNIIESFTERGDPLPNCLGVQFRDATIKGTYVMDIFKRGRSGVKQSLLQQYVKNPHQDGYLDGLTGSLEADQDFTIIETDGKNALILTCKDVNSDGVTDLIEIDFLSRGVEIQDNIYENYVNILEKYGFQPEFVPVNQENC